MDENLSSPSASPHWGSTTKLVVALTGLVIIGALVIRFRNIIVPLLMAVVLAYLLYPIASFLDRKTFLSWRGAVNIIYLILLALVASLLTLGGVQLVQQIQNLISTIQNSLNALPLFIEDLVGKAYRIGPLELNLSTVNWGLVSQEILANVQPWLGRLGGLVGTVAAGAASTLGWIAFIFIVSYFFLLESGGLDSRIIYVDIPGYAEDFRLLGEELKQIWNAFLRGQMIVFAATVLVYSVVLNLLAVRYAFWLALLAGIATFLPYVGPAVAWISLGLVALFQPVRPFDLVPLTYAAIVVGLAIGIDQIFNHLITPRILAQALKVHPAAILIMAIIAARLLGVIGVILAAPLLASLKLMGNYVLRKMLDQNPWPIRKEPPPPPPPFFQRLSRRLACWKEKSPWRRRQAEEEEPPPS